MLLCVRRFQLQVGGARSFIIFVEGVIGKEVAGWGCVWYVLVVSVERATGLVSEGDLSVDSSSVINLRHEELK